MSAAEERARAAAASLRLVRLALDRIGTVHMPPLERRGRRLDALAELSIMQREVDALLADLVAGARRDGASWSDVGHSLGVTKQAASQRFGERRPPAPAQPGPDLLDQLDAPLDT